MTNTIPVSHPILTGEFGAYASSPIVTYDKARDTYEVVMLKGFEDGNQVIKQELPGESTLVRSGKMMGEKIFGYNCKDENPANVSADERIYDVNNDLCYPLDKEMTLSLSEIITSNLIRKGHTLAGHALINYLKSLTETKYKDSLEFRDFVLTLASKFDIAEGEKLGIRNV